MEKRFNHFLLLFVILAVVLTSAVRTAPVYADDGVTEPPTGESTPPPEGGGTSVDEAPPPEEPAAATDVPEQLPEVVEPAATEEPVAATEQSPESAAPPVAEPAAEEPVAVSEILEQLPEDIDVTVLNNEGSSEPLATQEAANIVQSGDPRYTVGGVTYYFMPIGGCGALPNCTESATPIQAAVDALSSAGATPDDGTIYIEAGAYTEDVTVNGNSWGGGSMPAALTLSGAGSATTTLSGSLSITNMNIFTLSGITVTGADSSIAILNASNNTGTLTLTDVSATNTIGNGADLSGTGALNVIDSHFNGSTALGLIASTNGPVVVRNSTFDTNGVGLMINTRGDISLNTVTASNNTMTGAYLDSCDLGGLDPQVCAGNGAVTFTGTNQFNNNGIGQDAIGVFISSGGGIAITNTQANGNSFGGALLMSADLDGTGNVTVTSSQFNNNTNGGGSLNGAMGLGIVTDGGITLLDVDAHNNDLGAMLDTASFGTGAINITNSNFGTIAGTGNNWTGLHAESGSDIDLLGVTASDNGTNGAYLVAEGNITINSSTFDNNVQSNYPTDPGLFALSNGGNIMLGNLPGNVSASGNTYGAGAVLGTSGTGTITVNNGLFNQNGTFGIQAGSDSGSIALDNVVASYNQVKGAYLGTFSGDIAIDNSAFVENGSYGIYAFSGEGDISLDVVTVTGSDRAPGPGADDLTDYGALLETGGNIAVNDSTFNLNTDVGLIAISGSQVALANVTADRNGGNGVEVYSLTTAGPICEGESPVSIIVRVGGGAYTNNGGYGLLIKPGPQGTVVFGAPTIFSGNNPLLGGYLIDLNQEYRDCSCPPDSDKPSDSKGPLIVDVPETGGPTVPQDCEQYTGTILRLPNGTSVKIGCPFAGFSKLEQVPQESLPGLLLPGMDFIQALSFGLTDGQGNVILHEDGTVTISFVIPEGSFARRYSILYWDPALNDGAGGWVQLPIYEVGTSFPLNPDDSNDDRTVISGVQKVGNVVTVTLNFSGLFVLVGQ